MTLRHSSFLARPAAAIILLAIPLAAQTSSEIGRRVSSAPDGDVRMTFAARPAACGDGHDVVAVGKALNVYSSLESYGRWSGVSCLAGPARVALTVRDHRVVGIRSYVGGGWPAGDAGIADLGRVPAREAATYFLSLVPVVGSTSRVNPLLAAAIADSADVAPEILALAKDQRLARETRRRALHWVGALGSPAMVRPLAELARAPSETGRENADDVGPGDGLQGAAAGALAMLPGDAGIPALVDIAREAGPAARKAAVFWLGQAEDPRGRPLLRAIVKDGRESETLRGAAIFALGQGDRATEDDAAFLRGVFGELPTERLRDRVLMAMSQGESREGLRWLLATARDERQSVETRKKAAFWAGQGHAQLADLVSLYRDATEPRLREHLIFVLSQRDEEAATTQLMSIAREDPDREMRKKALFWLGQKNDPRVTKLITDMVLH